jgi:hypothetical protein
MRVTSALNSTHALNRPDCRKVLECASPLALFDGHSASESGRGLPQSKTLARGSWPRWAILRVAPNSDFPE